MHRILPLITLLIIKVSLLFGQADYMVVSVQPAETVAGQPIAGHPAVEVRDASNNPVGEGVEVTVAINKNSLTGTLTATTNASGITTFSNLILETADTGYELTFSSSGIPDLTTDAFEVIPAEPNYMTITHQPQNTLQKRAISGPPTVTLYDKFDNTISGIEITAFLNKSSFAAGSTETVVTNSNGQAVFSSLIIDDFDTGYEITFDADDADAPDVDNVTSNPFEIYEEKFTITIQNQPFHSVANYPIEGTEIINPIRVRVADMANNPVASGTVYVALNKGSFKVGSTTSASISGGKAIFNNLIIDVADTAYELIFSNPSVHIDNVTSDAFNVVAESATMSMDVNTSESIEGKPLYGPPTVYVDNGGPVVGEVITAYLNKNSFTGGSTITATTNAEGKAIFNNLIINDYTTNYRIFFKSTTQGIATITSDLFDVVAEVALLEVTQQPQLTIAGELINGPPTVTLKEKGTNNPVLGNILVTLNHGSFKGGSTTTVTTVNGVATFSNLRIDTPGDYIMTFSVPGASGVHPIQSLEFTVIPVEGNMTVTTQPTETIEGYIIEGTPTVTIIDIDDVTPLEGIAVTAILSKNSFTSGTTIVNTNASGQAIFNDLIIDDIDTGYTIFFSVPVGSGVVGKTSSAFDVVEEIAFLSVEEHPSLTIHGEVINGPPTVKIVDQSSNPINNVDIYVSLNKGSFASGTTSKKTNASGIAVFDDLVIDAADNDYQLIFSTQSSGVADISSAAFNVIPVAGTMTITTQPDESIEGYTVEGPPTIRILDPLDTPLQGIEVTAILSDNDFKIGSTTQLNTDIDGYAIFNNLTIDDVANDYSITFSVDVADGVVSKTSYNFDVVTEVAILSMSQQPTKTIAGQTLNGPPSVLIINKSTSNPIPSINIYVTLNKGSFKVGSTTMVTTNTSGIATFSNLIIDNDDTDYQLIFSTQSSGVADLASALFDVIPVVGVMTITQQPLESVEGYTVLGPPRVEILDLFDSPIDGIQVTAVLNKNSFKVGSTVQVDTDVNGIAVFDNLTIDDVANGYTIRFTIDVDEGIANKTSAAFDVKQEVAILSIEAQPTLTISGQKINGPPQVKIINKSTSNPIPSVNIYASLNKGSFNGSSTLMATTNASGIATFTNLIIDVVDDDYEIIFSTQSSGVANISSDPFNVIAVAGSITITQQPQETVHGYAIAGPPTVLVKNLSDAPIVGLNVTAIINKNSITSGTVTKPTGVDGTVVFDDLILSAVATGYELNFTIDVAEGIPNKTSNSFKVVAEVAVIAITQQPSLTIAGELINGPPTVTLKTPGGSPISGGNITVSLNKSTFVGGSTTTVTTNASGIATFSNLRINDADTDYQLTFSTGSSGVANKTSVNFDIVDPEGIMTITQQPLETVNGHPIFGPPTVRVTETDGTTPKSGVEVTVSVNKNGFTSGTTSLNTDVDGYAVFDDLILNAIATGYQLTFSIDISERIANKTSNSFNVVAVAGYLNITTQPSETVAGDPINGPPIVRLTNLSAQGVSGVTISVTLNKNSFNGGSTLTAVTNSTGYATFGNLRIDDFEPGYTIKFTAVGASGVAPVTSNEFEVTDATLSMDTVQQPTETVAGVIVTPSPQVHVYNGVGDIEGVVVSVSLNKGTFTGGSTLIATTNSSGIATFDNLRINTADAGYIITFNAAYSGVPNAQSNSFTITPAPPNYILVTAQPQNAIAGDEIGGPPSATAYDAFGNKVAGVEITVTPNQHTFASGVDVKTTNANGVAIFDDLVITTAASNYQLFFTSLGVTTGNSNSFAVGNAAPDNISIITQPSETVAGAAISGPPVVKVEDQYSNPVQGETVTISTVEGYTIDGGTLSLETPADGIVTFSDLVINTVGTYHFRFEVDGIEATSAFFSVIQGTVFSRFYGASHSGFTSFVDNNIALGQTPSRIEVISHPQETVAGTVIIGPPRIVVYDSFDNPMDNVSVTVSGAAFSAGVTTLSSDSNGEISYNGLIIDVTGTYTLTFTIDAFPAVTANSLPFDVINATATMSMNVQPHQTVAGQAVAGHPTVKIVNSIGMPIQGVNITVYINQHSFGSTSVTTVTTDVNGLAEFDELFIAQVASGYQLIFDADYAGTLNITSNTFNVINAPPHSMVVTTQPIETLEGATISGPPSVTVYDEYGNTVAGVSVTVSEVLEGYTFDSGITTISTNSMGVATFSTLVINDRGTYRLSFAAAGLTNVTSNSFQVVSGTVANRFKGSSHSGFTTLLSQDKLLGQTPVRIEVTSQPQETVAGFIVEGPPVIKVFDEIDNPVANVQVTVSLITGVFSSGTLTRSTNQNGEITFNNLVVGTPGTYRLSFKADNHTATVSDELSSEFEVVGQSYFMEVIVQPQNSVAGQPIAGPPAVSITNYIYQPLVGVNVTVYINQHGFASGSYTVQTDSEGEAVFDDLIINTAATGYQLIFDADYSGISNVASNTFNVSNAPADNLSIITQPGTTTEGAAIVGPPTVRLTDEYGNPVASATITVAETGGYVFDAGNTILITNSSGVASFSDLIINNMGQYSLTFSNDDVDDALSMSFNVTSGTVANRFFGNSHSGFTFNVTENKVLGQTPTRIQILTQPQETVVGFPVEGPPRVVVYDEVDNPIGGIDVTVSGAVFAAGTLTLTTGNNGEATFSGLVIDAAGIYQLEFALDDYPAITAQSSAFEVVDQQLFMTIQTQPSLTVAGQVIAGHPTVKIANGIGQGLEGVDITVYLNQNSFASAPLTQTVTTNVSGIAVFNQLVINVATTGYQLIFDADYTGVLNVTSNSFNVVAADAHTISINTQPVDTESGAVIGGPPTVTVTDQFGNPKSSVGVTVSETGGYAFDSGTTSKNTNTSGVAIFNDLIIGAIGQYSLTFSVTGIDDAVSVNFNILSGTVSNRFKGNTHSGFISHVIESQELGQTPTRMEIVTQPMETVAGFAIEGPPRIVVYDAVDNTVPNIWVSVTASGVGLSSGSTLLATNSSGEIMFNDLVIDQIGTYQLTFVAQDYPAISATSLSFDVVNQQLAMTLQVQPAQTVAGQVVVGHPTVKLANGIGQGFEGVDITVYLNQHSFASAPSTQTVTTNASGIAVFNQLVINVAATGYQLLFDADYSGVLNVSSNAFAVIAADPDAITITQQPLDTESGASIAGPPAVRVSDEFGNLIEGVSVTVSETGGYTFDSGTTSKSTNSSGIATFDNLVIDDPGQYNLTFSVTGVVDALSMNFNILSGTVSNRFKGNSHHGFTVYLSENQPLGQTPARIEVVAQPLETIVGLLIEGPPRIIVYDEFDRPMGGVSVTVTTGQAFKPGSSTTLLTNASGEITWSNLTLETPGTYQLTFTVNFYAPVVSAQSAQFEVISPQLFLTISVQPVETIAGQTIAGPPKVRLATALNQGQAGVDITVYINQFSFTSAIETQTVTTDAQGYAEFNQLVISTAATGYQLIFDADINGVVNITSNSFNVINGAPHSMVVSTQPLDTEDGAVVQGPPAVTVYDAYNNVLSGISVTVAETGGYIFPSGTLTQTTNAFGVATFSNLLMEDLGTYSLTFSVTGIPNVVSNTFIVYSGNVSNRFKGNSHSGFISGPINSVELAQQPTRLEIITQPQETIAGNTIAGPPHVRLYDEVDNPVGGVTINVYIAGSGSPVFGVGSTLSVVTDSNGNAIFNNLIVNVTGTFTLTFEADGYDGIVPNAISQNFDVVNPMVQMSITTQPAQTVAGQAIVGHPTVRLTTVTLNQPFEGVQVTAYINQNSFASGTQTVTTNVDGYAIFNDLIINVAASGYQIIFDTDYTGITNQTSIPFAVVPAPAHHMTIITQPTNTQANSIIGGPPTVGLFDEFENPIQGVSITISEQGGYTFDLGTTSRTTDINGRTSFNDLIISTAGYYMINFDAAVGGVPDIQSQQFRILPTELAGRFKGNSHSGFIHDEEKNVLLKQVPTYIEILTQPQQTVSGTYIQGYPRVAVYDQLYQPIINSVVTVSVVGGTTPAMTGTTTRTTNASGEITFNDLTIVEIKSHRLYFQVGGYPALNATSQLFDVIAPVLSMAIHVQPINTVAGQVIGGNPSVIITDDLSNGVENINVTVYLNQFAFTSDPGFATVSTNEFGIAVFEHLVIEQAATNYQLLFEADYYGINNVTSSSFTIFPAAPDYLIITTQPQTSVTGAAIQGPPAATLYDEFGNTISGAEITVSEAGGEPLGPSTAVNTNAIGVASFTNLVIDNAGTYQLIFDNADVDAVTSLSFVVTSSNIAGRFMGNSHSGFTSTVILEQPLSVPSPVETPVFQEPITTEMCEGTSATFTATAEHSDSLRYSINPAAFGTINRLNGSLQLNMNFSGTVYVVATAYGFEGPQKDSVAVTVKPNVDMPQFQDPVIEVCQGTASTPYTATTIQPSTIEYTSDPLGAGSINGISGLMTWDAGFSGAATIFATATATNGCGDPKTNSVVVTINPAIGDPVFTQGAVEVCQDAPNETYQATSSNAEAITYSLSNGAAGTLNQNTGVMNWAASFHGTVTITATATGCAGPKTVNRVVTVHPLPSTSAISGMNPAVCESVGVEYSVVLTSGSSYAWTVPTGASIASGATGPENNLITVDFGENNGNITVVETSTHGCVGAPVSLAITLDGCGMQADFEASATTICNGSSITFTDLSTDAAFIDTWTWTFNGGSPTGATGQGPHTVTFNTPGTYQITLVVVDGVASDSHSKDITVLPRGLWEGTISENWADANNWACGIIPTSSIDVTIPTGVPNYPTVSTGTANARNITIQNGAQLTISGQTLNVYGNWANNGTFNLGGTVVFRGTPSSISGTSTTTFNNLTVFAGASLTAPANMNIRGNFVANGTFTHNNGTITLTGGTEQEISGSAANLVLYSLIMNKDLTTSVTLQRNVDISNSLTLTQGIIRTSDTKLLRLMSTATSSIGSDNSHVDGPIQKTGGTSFIFPTGNNWVWAPIEIAATGVSSESFRAQYFFTGHPASGQDPCTNCASGVYYVHNIEYWDLRRVGGTTKPNVTMYFKNMGRSGIAALDNLVYAHWNSTSWENKTLGGSAGLDGTGGCYITGTGFPDTYNIHAPGKAAADDPCSAIISLFSPLSGNTCDGDQFELRVEFTGLSPFKLTYTDGEGNNTVIENITDNPFIFPVNAIWLTPTPLGPIFEYTYTIVEVLDDNGCTTSGEGSATIRVYKLPETGPQYHVPNSHGY